MYSYMCICMSVDTDVQASCRLVEIDHVASIFVDLMLYL